MSSSSETMATRGEARHLTTTGTMVGTAAYMSPEQIRAQELGGQTDLFSFEAVLYELSGCRSRARHPARSAAPFCISSQSRRRRSSRTSLCKAAHSK